MMKLYFLLVVLFLLPVASGFQYSDGLVIESGISNRVEFVKTAGNPSFSYLNIYHSWVPVVDYRQEVLGFSSSPESVLSDGVAVFEITELGDVEVSLVFTTRTTSKRVEVKEKVFFPLEDLDPSLLKYTEPRGLININPGIRSVASEIVGDTDDLYEAVFRLSDWVNRNIEYNLSTLSEEATKSSSWVLEERRGVCVELTNLFISMARSLGIPAKFVSGISYTDSELFDFNWGGHGWAEVYFPGYGWVPVDPTYNQIGFVDSSHIKLEEGVEGNKYNTRYEWMGRGFEVRPGPQSINSEVVREGVDLDEGVSLSISFLEEEVGFGSYNVIIGSIRNSNDFYVVKEFMISRTDGLDVLSPFGRNVLLRPLEEKEVYWVVRVNYLEPGFIYTFPVLLYDARDLRVEDGFRVSSRGRMVGESTAGFFFEEVRISGVSLECSQRERFVYAGSDIVADCVVFRDVPGSVSVCLDRLVCEDVFVDGNEDVSLSVVAGEPGHGVFVVEASDGVGSARSFLDFGVLDDAVVSFVNVSGGVLSFGDEGSLGFSLGIGSVSVPRNVSVSVEHSFFGEEFFLDRLDDYRDFVFGFNSRDLKPGENVFIISVVYLDEKGREYLVEEEVMVYLEGVSFFERVRLWLNYINAWF